MNGFVQAVKDKKILFFGHQGAYGERPGNAMSGFKRAIELGADGIETDLHGTIDGHIVLMHDDDVSTTTLSKGRLTQMTFEEVRKLNVAGKFRPGFEVETVPTLEELLDLVKDVPGFLLNLELKDYPEEIGDVAYRTIDESVRLVEEAGMGDRVLFSSLSCGALRYVFEKYNKKYPIQSVYPEFLMYGDFDYDLYENALYVVPINVEVREDGSHDWLEAQRVPVPAHEELAKLKSYDVVLCISVSPWDTEEHTRRCLEEGYGMFTCNYPSTAKRIFEEMGLR